MGTYLATGVVQSIRIPKEEKVKLETMKDALGLKVDLGKFDFIENDNWYIWEIKDSVLEDKTFVPFLKQQFRYYDPSKVNELDQLASMSAQEIKNFAKEQPIIKGTYCFQFVKNLIDWEYVDDIRYHTVDVYYNMLCFFIDGKIIMECYNDILHYFEELIRLQKKEYPIATCVKVMITS